MSDNVYVLDKFGNKVKIELVVDSDTKQVSFNIFRRNKQIQIPEIKDDNIFRRIKSNKKE